MIEEALVRIEMLQSHISAIEAAASCLFKRRHHGFQIEYGNLRTTLFEEELDEWRKLFMWGLTLSDEERDRIKAAAYQRFLSNKTHVAYWINDGISPGQWLAADEDEFRAMAKEAFKPSNG
jgi:hypothetical protein